MLVVKYSLNFFGNIAVLLKYSPQTHTHTHTHTQITRTHYITTPEKENSKHKIISVIPTHECFSPSPWLSFQHSEGFVKYAVPINSSVMCTDV